MSEQIVKKINENGLVHEYEFIFTNQFLNQKIDQKLAQIQPKYKMNGFRSGKVPHAFIRKNNLPKLFNEVFDNVLNETISEIIKTNQIKPALPPRLGTQDIDQFDQFIQNNDIATHVIFELMPEIPETNYSKIDIKIYKLEPSRDEAIDVARQMLKEYTEYNKQDDGYIAMMGDRLDISITQIGINKELSNKEDYSIILGEDNLNCAIDAQLIGVRTGETRVVTAKFSNNHHALKDGELSININEIYKVKNIEFNDETVKDKTGDSLEELIEKIKSDIISYTQGSIRQLIKKELFDKMNEIYTFDCPPTLIADEIKILTKEEEVANHDELLLIAARRVRLALILMKLTEDHSIEVAPDDLTQAIANQAKHYNIDKNQLLQLYAKNNKMLYQMRNSILEEKAVDFILEKTNKTKISVTTDQLKKLTAEQDGDDYLDNEHIHDENCNH